MAFYHRPVDSNALRRSVLGVRRWHMGQSLVESLQMENDICQWA